MGSSAFARRYLRNHCCFLFLRVLRCFSSPRSPHLHGNISSRYWVAPFGNPRIYGHLRLPAAYRSLSRPSSPLRAKASPVRPYLTFSSRVQIVIVCSPRPRHSGCGGTLLLTFDSWLPPFIGGSSLLSHVSLYPSLSKFSPRTLPGYANGTAGTTRARPMEIGPARQLWAFGHFSSSDSAAPPGGL